MAITLNGTTGIVSPKVNTPDLELNSVNVVERGSNANGGYVRFADGTQICHASDKAGSAAGGQSWTYPAVFVVNPTVVCNARGASAYTGSTDVTGTGTSVLFSAWSVGSSPARVAVGVELTAIGRWF